MVLGNSYIGAEAREGPIVKFRCSIVDDRRRYGLCYGCLKCRCGDNHMCVCTHPSSSTSPLDQAEAIVGALQSQDQH